MSEISTGVNLCLMSGVEAMRASYPGAKPEELDDMAKVMELTAKIGPGNVVHGVALMVKSIVLGAEMTKQMKPRDQGLAIHKVLMDCLDAINKLGDEYRSRREGEQN